MVTTHSAAITLTLPSDREIVINRVFDAPRRLVYDAMTKPELIMRWLSGPPGESMVVCENDVKEGGVFRHVWRGAGGTEMTMRGVDHEVVPPERIVRTESFEFGGDSPAGEQLGTLVLTEQDGKTNLTLTLLYQVKEARDATIASGIERGVAAAYDRLEELLASTRA